METTKSANLASIHDTAARCKNENIGLSESAIRRLVKTGDMAKDGLQHDDLHTVVVDQGGQ